MKRNNALWSITLRNKASILLLENICSHKLIKGSDKSNNFSFQTLFDPVFSKVCFLPSFLLGLVQGSGKNEAIPQLLVIQEEKTRMNIFHLRFEF